MAAPSFETRPFASFEWLIALRYLRARRREGFVSVISLFSFLGITLGVATLIVVMSVLNGFRAELLDKILGFSGHANLYRSGLSVIDDYNQLADKITKIPDIVRVTPLVEGQALTSSTSASIFSLVRGISESDIMRLKAINNDRLRTAMADESVDGADGEGVRVGIADAVASFKGFDRSTGVVIGERMAWRLQVGLGEKISLLSPKGPDTIIGNTPRLRDYTVVGIFKVGMSDYDENVLYMPLAEAQDYFLTGEGVSSLEIMVDNPDQIERIVAQVQKISGDGFSTQSWKGRNQGFFTALNVERNVTFLVLVMIVLVAALNIISGLTMLVKDKGRDIAVLRTMGASQATIMRIFFIAGKAIGVSGTLMGLILGLAICLNIESLRQLVQWFSGVDPFSADIYYLSQLPARIEPLQVVLIVLVALGLSFLATLYPSWRAARLDPLEALRYE